MNIFVLHHEPEIAAKYHCDKHVVKMIVESAQMLSAVNAHYGKPTLLTKSGTPFRVAYKNHPCTVWARQSLDNYRWLVKLAVSLCEEYTFRYGKKHCLESELRNCFLTCASIKFEYEYVLTPFAQAMPDKYKDTQAVQAYRNYYIGEKKRIAKWTKREAPCWID